MAGAQAATLSHEVKIIFSGWQSDIVNGGKVLNITDLPCQLGTPLRDVEINPYFL